MKKVLLFFALAAIVSVGILALYQAFKPTNQSPPEKISATPAPTAAKTEPEEKRERNAKLQTETDALLPLFGKMPQVPVYLKDEIIKREGSNVERGVAYTTCENKNQPVIFVKKVFYEKANRKMLTNILKHELTHAWQCREGMMWGHDEQFRKKFKAVGGFGN